MIVHITVTTPGTDLEDMFESINYNLGVFIDKYEAQVVGDTITATFTVYGEDDAERAISNIIRWRTVTITVEIG